jgi:hypothetical protein
MKVKFKEWTCEVEFCKYGNGSVAIRLNDANNGKPIAVASINLEGIAKVKKGEIAIRNYSENDTMLKTLMDAGIVSAPLRYAKSGYVTIPICNLLIKE